MRETARTVRTLATKAWWPSSDIGIHMIEGKQLQQTILWFPPDHCLTSINIHNFKIQFKLNLHLNLHFDVIANMSELMSTLECLGYFRVAGLLCDPGFVLI